MAIGGMSGTRAPLQAASAISLYARATVGFEARVNHALGALRAAANDHAGHIVQATSLGAEDMVVTDLIARHGLDIDIATLDTRQLHAQTLVLIGRIESHYGRRVAVYAPEHGAVLHFVAQHGDDAMRRSLPLRQACCALRKLEPLSRLLASRSAWVTGLRREQSQHRGEVAFSARDDAGRTKLSPLADWSWQDVWHYIALHQVPHNPLHDQFMPSIGCAPCTRAIAVGEDFRAGRWWWEQDEIKECGLHSKPAVVIAPAPHRSRKAGATTTSSATAP